MTIRTDEAKEEDQAEGDSQDCLPRQLVIWIGGRG
jgi:hypothetical protein